MDILGAYWGTIDQEGDKCLISLAYEGEIELPTKNSSKKATDNRGIFQKKNFHTFLFVLKKRSILIEDDKVGDDIDDEVDD